MTSAYHLAQLNIGRLLAPVDDPLVAEFMDNLAQINALAEEAPGFVWRLQTAAGDATGIEVVDGDPHVIVNMSVWTDAEALADYTYRSDHTAFMRRRAAWFEPRTAAHLVLWWVVAGDEPTVEEGLERLEQLRAHGPSDEGFTFRERFAAPA